VINMNRRRHSEKACKVCNASIKVCKKCVTNPVKAGFLRSVTYFTYFLVKGQRNKYSNFCMLGDANGGLK